MKFGIPHSYFYKKEQFNFYLVSYFQYKLKALIFS